MNSVLSLETEQVLEALEGAVKGTAAAVEDGTITATQFQCLFDLLLKQLKISLLN